MNMATNRRNRRGFGAGVLALWLAGLLVGAAVGGLTTYALVEAGIESPF